MTDVSVRAVEKLMVCVSVTAAAGLVVLLVSLPVLTKQNEHVGLKKDLFLCTAKGSVVPRCRKVMFFVFYCKGGQWRQPRKCFR